MTAPTIGSLFSGYGGLELGIQHVYPDAQVMWQSEIDEGCQRLLKQVGMRLGAISSEEYDNLFADCDNLYAINIDTTPLF